MTLPKFVVDFADFQLENYSKKQYLVACKQKH